MAAPPEDKRPRIVLASASPVRRRLLVEAGFKVSIIPSRASELKGRGRTLAETVRENARRKAAAVARRCPDAVVVAADTMIEVDGRPFGKPATRRVALATLARLAGRTHRLATGVCVVRRGRRSDRVTFTRVRLRPLAPARIAALLRSYDPTRVAGGYVIRRGRDPLIAGIEGSFSNVEGLPLETTRPLLLRILQV